MNSETIRIYPDADTLARAAADDLLRLARQSIAARGRFILALAGGSTPKRLYNLLATDPAYLDFPWARTHLFIGDERHVPPQHADSNYRMIQESLLRTGLVPAPNLRRVQSEFPDAKDAAADYEVRLRHFFNEPALQNHGFPCFDVIQLGMGPDGHTASLFPGTAALKEAEKWVVANWVEKFKTDRITFTYPVLNAAREVHLMVAGADKADILHEVLVTKAGQSAYPVQGVQPSPGVKVWLLDAAAAAKLPKS